MPRLEGKNNSGTRWAMAIGVVVVLAAVVYFGVIRQMSNTELIDTTDTNIARPEPPRVQAPPIEPQIDPNAANAADNGLSPNGTPAANAAPGTPAPGGTAPEGTTPGATPGAASPGAVPPGEGTVVNPDGSVTTPVPTPEGNASSPPAPPDAGQVAPGAEGSSGVAPSSAGSQAVAPAGAGSTALNPAGQSGY